MTDPRWHWDGQRWLWWDGAQWVVPYRAAPPTAPKRRSAAPRIVLGVIGVLLVSGVVGALALGNPTVTTTTTNPHVVEATQSDTPTTDPQASLACVHFRNIMDDIGKGILTPAQIHDKAQEVYDDSIIAPTDVRAAAQAMLAATVADDGVAFATASVNMDKACRRAGT